jgi:hypothetical protein
VLYQACVPPSIHQHAGGDMPISVRCITRLSPWLRGSVSTATPMV